MVRPSFRRSHIRVTGRVQGVGFRFWARGVAYELGVSGWVRNEPDGSVAVHAAGSEEAMEEFVRRLGLGPPSARVASVRVVGPVTAVPEEGFEIRF